MSHFTTVKTQMVSTEHLVQALRDLGFTNVESHEVPQALYGYRGDVRPQRSEVIVRRQFIGPASNDIGFTRDSTGTFVAVVSEFDRRKYDTKWLERLTQRYAYHVAKDQLEAQDFTVVEEEVQADNTIHITVRRMV